MKLKTSLLAVAVVLASWTALIACPDQTLGGKIDDALDNRPAEKLQDKAEDIKDQIKDATN